MDKKERAAELVYSTNELESTGKHKPTSDVNVNAVRPVFIKRDRTEVPIASMSDEEITEAIHFTTEFIDREEAKIEKMNRIRKYLIIESASRLRLQAEELGEDPNQLEEERVVSYRDYYDYKRSKYAN